LKLGETDTVDIYLINNYREALEAMLEISDIEQFVKTGKFSFVLNSGEMKALTLNFSIPLDTLPDNYVGKVIIKEPSGKSYESFISIDVQSISTLFDVSLVLDEARLPAFPGGYIFFKTTIYNLGENKSSNISLEYTIKDTNGKIIFQGDGGTELMQSYLEKEGKIKLPKNIAPGKYVLSEKVDYSGKIAVASSNFSVDKKKLKLTWIILIIIALILIILLIFWIIGKKGEEKDIKERERKQELLRY